MNIREWTLPVYTILMQIATGAFLTLWVLRAFLIKKYSHEVLDRINRYPLLIIFITILSAMIGSHFHLSQPNQSFLAMLNYRSSWLSREIIFNVLYFLSVAGLLDTIWDGAHREKLKTNLGWIAITLGMVTIYCMGKIYLLPVQAGWNTTYTIFSFYGSTLLLGVLSFTLLMMLDLKFSELKASEDISIRKMILHKSLGWFTLSVIIITIAIIAINTIHISNMFTGDNTAQISLQLLFGLYRPLLVMRIIVMTAGMCILVLTYYLVFIKQKTVSDLLTPIYITCLCAMIGEIIGRYLFYATHIRVGI